MNLTQLEGFLAVTSEGSFTKAAAKLYLTQPALSSQIKALEDDLGQLIFERDGKQLRLTNAGRLLQQRAKEILDLVEQTRQDVTGLKEFQRGQLAIAATESTFLYILPTVLQFFREKFPGIELRLLVRKSSEVGALVAEGEIDFGLATLPLLDARVKTETLFWREDVAICGNGHPLALLADVALADIAAHSLLLLEPGSTTRTLIEQRLALQGLVPAAVIDVGSVEVVKRLVEINLGVAVVPGIAVAAELRAGQLRAYRLEWLPARAIGLVQRRNGYLAPASLLFLKLLKNHVPNVLLCPALG